MQKFEPRISYDWTIAFDGNLIACSQFKCFLDKLQERTETVTINSCRGGKGVHGIFKIHSESLTIAELCLEVVSKRAEELGVKLS